MSVFQRESKKFLRTKMTEYFSVIALNYGFHSLSFLFWRGFKFVRILSVFVMTSNCIFGFGLV